MEKNNGMVEKGSHSLKKLFQSTFIIYSLIIILAIAIVPGCGFRRGSYEVSYFIYNHQGEKIYVSWEYYDPYNRGQEFVKTGQYDLAIAEYTKAIQVGLQYPFAYFARGSAYIQKGQYDLAIRSI